MAFKMKGHTLPGIKQLKSNDNEDGRSGSAAFQQSDPFAGSSKDDGLRELDIIEASPLPEPMQYDFSKKFEDFMSDAPDMKEKTGGPFDQKKKDTNPDLKNV